MKNSFELAVLKHPDDEDPEKQDLKKKEREAAIQNSLEIPADWVSRMLENKDSYSERIPLKNDGTFDVPENVTELPMDVAQLVRSSHMERSEEGLYRFAKRISEKYPELRFTFKRDPEGGWIEYSARKFKIGDAVSWEPGGVLQWHEPKAIKEIKEDPKSKKKFAFFEGSYTGVPMGELVMPPAKTYEQ